MPEKLFDLNIVVGISPLSLAAPQSIGNDTGLETTKKVIAGIKPKKEGSFSRRTARIIAKQPNRSTYEATLPDGTVARKQSCDVHQDTAILGCWEYRAKWVVGLIYDQTTTVPLGTGLTLVRANRLTVLHQRNPIAPALNRAINAKPSRLESRETWCR